MAASKKAKHARGLRRFSSDLAAIEESLVETNISDDEIRDPTCRICVSKAKRPVLLSCGHVFCWSCIVVATSWKNKSCPRCLMPHNIGPEV